MLKLTLNTVNLWSNVRFTVFL